MKCSAAGTTWDTSSSRRPSNTSGSFKRVARRVTRLCEWRAAISGGSDAGAPSTAPRAWVALVGLADHRETAAAARVVTTRRSRAEIEAVETLTAVAPFQA